MINFFKNRKKKKEILKMKGSVKYILVNQYKITEDYADFLSFVPMMNPVEMVFHKYSSKTYNQKLILSFMYVFLTIFRSGKNKNKSDFANTVAHLIDELFTESNSTEYDGFRGDFKECDLWSAALDLVEKDDLIKFKDTHLAKVI